MEPLIELLRVSEGDILARVFELAQRHGYTRYSSTLIEAWRASVKGLTEALVAGLSSQTPLDFGVDDDRSSDPVTTFGREAALRHRSRGVTLAMFLGLTKYYRDAYADSCAAQTDEPTEKARRRHVIARLFDRIELGFCEAWSRADASTGSAALEQANRVLANEKNRYLTVLESILDAVFVVGPTGEVLYANPAALSLAGQRVEPGAARYGPALEVLNARRPDWLAPLLAQPGQRLSQTTLPAAEGSRSFVAQVTPILDITAKTEGVVLVLRDLTELRQADRERRELKAVFDAVTRSAGDGIAIVDDGGVVEFWNRAAEAMFGWSREEAVGRDPRLLMLGGAPLDHALAGPATRPTVFQARRRDGSPLDLELIVSEVPTDDGRRTLLVARDVTERRRTEAKANVSARLEAVGRLAGGIAHEINTPIQFVGDSLSFLRDATRALCGLTAELVERAAEPATVAPWAASLGERLEALDVAFLLAEAPRAVERAVDGVGRVGDLVRAMKDFGHPGTGQMAPADLNLAVRNALVVSRPSWKHVAVASFEESPLPAVVCRAEQVSQVVLNLVVNAADAISERASGGQGRIVVRTAVDGGEVVIEVEDDGVGIAPVQQPHVFQPFFTTKEPGRGIGQGLALSRHIVVDTHRGTLTFRSTPGHGSLFTVRLPIDPLAVGSPGPPAGLTSAVGAAARLA